jgi:hypothetical protein
MNHPLDGARKRLERADKHFQDLRGAIHAYAVSEANNIVVDYDAVRNQPNIILAPKTALPVEFALIVSDCIHNLRAALDYLVFELSREDSGNDDPLGTKFPIATKDEFAKYRKARLNGKGPLRYLSDGHVNAIETYQPYNGVQWTKTLQDISNPDKHRKITRIRSGRRTNIADGRGALFKGVGPNRTDVQIERTVTLRIFFGDKTPVMETLKVMKREIQSVIDSFSAEFKV